MKTKNRFSAFVILSIISILGLTCPILAYTGDDNYNHHGMMGDMYGMMSGTWGYGGMFFGWLIGPLFIIALILLIVWLIKQIQKK